MRKTTIFFIVIDILAISCFILFYGPWDFKNIIVNTAMVTKSHQYIAYTFYSEEMVNKILSLNTFVPVDEEIELDDIVIDTSEKDTYDNEYDEEILTRDEGNDDYKYLQVKVGKYKAHLVAIYNPENVTMMTSRSFNTGSGQETIPKMCKRYGGLVCINGGGFKDPDGWGSDIPVGYVIKDGEVIWAEDNTRQNIIGITYDHKLLLVNATGEEAIDMGMRDGLQFGPFLIVNGESIQYQSSVGGYDRAARVAIAQRKDGVILFLATEGTHGSGPTMKEVIDTLELYGAYNAANLDGGTSSQMVINGKMVNNPKNVFGQSVAGGRRVVTGFALIPTKE
ncbi:MAG: phosphodiester glycosidase family protein [Bacilli bacterium]|nr:phosphodiester glycosidase family protein [Bacilli bacterium]